MWKVDTSMKKCMAKKKWGTSGQWKKMPFLSANRFLGTCLFTEKTDLRPWTRSYRTSRLLLHATTNLAGPLFNSVATLTSTVHVVLTSTCPPILPSDPNPRRWVQISEQTWYLCRVKPTSQSDSSAGPVNPHTVPPVIHVYGRYPT